ncbi:peptidoglycan DD-metalloendopeptidase family protein [Clostridium sp. DSM 100503]|uniref:peptidoglycan DD-metalloendopeptidase family protein n=1 Tax=Clostridium sp. DSM 100503 TaxID=2963282 RepID=UPI00214A0DEF|nr:peptidoglycan DD-metalloendopeptidase family protein [Clostridium sp. DSM 100503]MCR1952082.1 peptidoglycan DD-metalloendopeptidase family protein [Clostridium sp. DSM 100503]
MDTKGDSGIIIKYVILSIFSVILTININCIKVSANTNDALNNIDLNNSRYSLYDKISDDNIFENLIVAVTGKINGYEVKLDNKVIGYTSIENNLTNIKDLVLRKVIDEMNINEDSVLSFEINGDIDLQESRFDLGLLQTNDELANYIYKLSQEESSKIKLNVKYTTEENVKIQPNTIIIPSDSMYLGESKVEYGEVGLKKQVKEVTYENNKLIETKVVSEEVIKEQISKKIYRGTKNPYDYGVAFLSSPTRGGYMTSGYGERWNSFHKGIDIAGNIGDDVLVAMDGEITYAQYNDGGYGNLIMVKHEDNMVTYYGHLSDFYVKVGDKVKKGDIIGAIGNTGFSTGPHLHFELRVDNDPVDPTNYIVQ